MNQPISLVPLDIELMHKALEATPDALVIMDETGAPRFINAAARELLRTSKPASSFYEMLLHVLSFNPLSFTEDGEREVPINGSMYYVSVHPLFISRGKRGAVLFFRSFSMLKQAEDLKTDFVTIASHELRNPLTSLKNALDILIRKGAGETTPKQENFLHIAMRNANRISTLVNDYLDLSKIELNKVSFQFMEHTLDEIVYPVIEELKERAAGKKISLGVDLPPHLPHILADASKVEQIFVNLVENALKYSDDGGSISVSAREVMTHARDGYDQHMVEVTIADTGIGIPEDKRELIFNKFYRIKRAIEVREEGSGLGLAVVKKLVERHGGTIHVEDNVPAGSKFCFTLPTYKGERRDPQLRLLLDREVERARKNQCFLSLIIIMIENFKAILKHNGEERAELILEKVERSVKDSLYRTADVFVSHKKGEILVVICETEKQGAEIICRRIKQHTAQVLDELSKSLSCNLQFRFGVASYPNDAENQRELFKKALAHAKGDEDAK